MKLNIDFTKLAKIADVHGKKKIADFLINFEKSIVKKIPFLLEVKQFEKALVFAIEGGDPNIINKVISEILKQGPESQKQNGENRGLAIQMLSNVPDGLRHLRNYARSRRNDELMTEISQVGKAPTDFYSATSYLRSAYASVNHIDRVDNIRNA